MVYLLILVILGVVAAPVMWLRPNGRQKQIAALREVARAEGLNVGLKPVPSLFPPHSRTMNMDIAVYALAWTEAAQKRDKIPPNCISGLGPDGAWLLHRFQQPEAVGTLLSSLPDSTQVLELNRGGISVYWREKGTPDGVRTMAKTLKDLRDILEQGAAA